MCLSTMPNRKELHNPYLPILHRYSFWFPSDILGLIISRSLIPIRITIVRAKLLFQIMPV